MEPFVVHPLRRRRVLAWPAALLIGGRSPAAAAAPRAAAPAPQAVAAVLQKLGLPSSETMKVFADAGMNTAAAHAVTPAERQALEAVLRRTPARLLQAAAEGVESLNFIQGLGGYGSGLTRVPSAPGEARRCEITLRADIFTDELGAMLTRKERLSLKPDEAAQVTVLAGRQTALRYVLTHELAHVWEATLEPQQLQHFRAGVWQDARTLAPELERSALVRSAFRRHPPQSVQALLGGYRELVRSPLVSFYATASAHEDFAETTAWALLDADGEAPLQVVFAGDEPQVFAPLSNRSARRRMDLVSSLL
jgi:hypothetical protein